MRLKSTASTTRMGSCFICRWDDLLQSTLKTCPPGRQLETIAARHVIPSCGPPQPPGTPDVSRAPSAAVKPTLPCALHRVRRSPRAPVRARHDYRVRPGLKSPGPERVVRVQIPPSAKHLCSNSRQPNVKGSAATLSSHLAPRSPMHAVAARTVSAPRGGQSRSLLVLQSDLSHLVVDSRQALQQPHRRCPQALCFS